MSEQEYDIRTLVARLKVGHFQGYLLRQGWHEKPSQHKGQLYFQGQLHEGEEAYELYLPASTSAAKYQTQLMRAIYKLCGIEDREPAEIARDMFECGPAVRPAEAATGMTRLHARNSGSRPLVIRVGTPLREHSLLPGEAVELVCSVGATGVLEIEHFNESITIRSLSEKPS